MAKKVQAKKAVKGKEKVEVYTGIGRLLYPALLEPNKGPYDKDKYVATLMISQDEWKKSGGALKEAVVKVAREFFNNPKITAAPVDKALKLFTHGIRTGEQVIADAENPEKKEYMRGHIIIKAKSDYAPKIVGPDTKELSEDDAARIKSGDYARLVVSVFPYSKGDGGVTFGLQIVQFAKSGPAIGGGNAAAMELLEEIEVQLDDVEDGEEEENDETMFEDEEESEDDSESTMI